jgi:hypothetical protein
MKKKHNPNRGNELRTINQRLLEIKNTLNEIQGHAMETKDTRGKLENILAELAEVKQHLAQRNKRQPRQQRTPRYTRKRRGKGEASIQTLPAEEPKGETTSDIDSKDSLKDLLQNPSVQSLLAKTGDKTAGIEKRKNKGKETSEKDESLGELLSNVDVEQVAKLLQNPMVQSMLKSIL